MMYLLFDFWFQPPVFGGSGYAVTALASLFHDGGPRLERGDASFPPRIDPINDIRQDSMLRRLEDLKCSHACKSVGQPWVNRRLITDIFDRQ
jgi:hypothetical protein